MAYKVIKKRIKIVNFAKFFFFGPDKEIYGLTILCCISVEMQTVYMLIYR